MRVLVVALVLMMVGYCLAGHRKILAVERHHEPEKWTDGRQLFYGDEYQVEKQPENDKDDDHHRIPRNQYGSVWIERNNVIFNGTTPNPEKLYDLIVIRLGYWLSADEPSFPYSVNDLIRSSVSIKNWQPPKTQRPLISWQPPPSGLIKWNVDGSAMGKPGLTGIGGVLRDERSLFKAIFSCSIGSADSNVEEIKAVAMAVSLSSSNDWIRLCDVIIESDSKSVISWLNGNYLDAPWKVWNCLSDIKEQSKSIRSVSFQHILREGNSVADSLAKAGVSRSSDLMAWL